LQKTAFTVIIVKDMHRNKEPFNVLTAFTLLVSITLAGVLYAADFRGNSWGDSPEEVIAVEGEPNLRDLGEPCRALIYHGDYGGIPSAVEYCFTPSGHLAIGHYLIEKTQTLDAYVEWTDIVSKIYGSPTADDILYTDDEGLLESFYSGDQSKKAEGITRVYYELSNDWDTVDTAIYIAAYPYEGNIQIVLSFASKVFRRGFLDSLDEKPLDLGTNYDGE
jgi:hypothetical protein